jgi:hypothetical protein
MTGSYKGGVESSKKVTPIPRFFGTFNVSSLITFLLSLTSEVQI